jgi:hypothetical protein
VALIVSEPAATQEKGLRELTINEKETERRYISTLAQTNHKTKAKADQVITSFSPTLYDIFFLF